MKLLGLLFLSTFSLSSLQSTAQLADNSKAFDFWIGDWEVSWYDQDSNLVKGSNLVEATLDGKVLQENFVDPNRGFKGTSISVYSPRKKSWHQAWADNRGGYYNFIGLVKGDRRIFTTDTSNAFIQRMVFYNIKADSFTWDWETSKDGGENFQLSWRIFYQRKEK